MQKKKNGKKKFSRKSRKNLMKIQELDTDTFIYRLLNQGWFAEETKKQTIGNKKVIK